MMSEYVRPSEALNLIRNDKKESGHLRRGSQTIRNNILDLATIENKAKTNSQIDKSETNDPLLSPTLGNKFKNKKSKFALSQEYDPAQNSPSSKFALMQKDPLPTRQFKADRNANRARNDMITDVSFLDYTDLDLLSIKNATTNYLLIQNRNELYRNIWAMFSNT